MKPEHEFISEALTILCPNGFGYNGHEITTNSDPVPTQAELDAQVEIQKAEYDALAWKRSREAEYPTIAELTVALYDTDDKADIEAKRAAVKAKYPKPS
jgi:hypothetical protein